LAGFFVLFLILIIYHYSNVFYFSDEGGFDLLGRTVDQIRTTEQVNATRAACLALKLDGLVIIGGNHLNGQFVSILHHWILWC